MHVNYNTECCGIVEIANICDVGEAEEILKKLLTDEECLAYSRNELMGNQYKRVPATRHPAHLIFTDIAGNMYGRNLARYITGKKLGSVAKTKAAHNPNSHNKVTCWVWTPNWDAVQKKFPHEYHG